MDFKRKFRSFIVQQGLLSPSGQSAEENAKIHISDQPPPIKEEILTEAELITKDPQVGAEILASIEDIYYSDDSFDSSLYELQKLTSDEVDKGYVKSQRHLLWRQQQVVSKKVSDLILQNQAGYTQELKRVTDLQTNLQQALLICGSGRSRLRRATDEFTIASLGILAKYRKRQHLSGLLRSLHTIKTLQQTDVRLRELMEEEDYPGAIQLCLACQKAASTFRHYKCISELSSKLQDTLVMIEEQLDVALSSVCGSFDTDHYQKLQKAYRLLGKTQTSMDQLHMHFTSAIHNKAFAIILGYVELCKNNTETNYQKRQYSDLCTFMTAENFMACLLDLCKALWVIMHSYKSIMVWHERNDSDAANSNESESSVESTLNKQYIKQKLEHGLLRIWQDIQHKVKLYVQAVDLSAFKFDEFIQVLDTVNRLIQIGEEFCGSKSEALQDSMKKQSINYFRNYHRSRMDELKIFLENEGWEICPVKSNFSIFKLVEFKFMTQDNFQQSSPSSSFSESIKNKVGFFSKYRAGGNPFDVNVNGNDDVEDLYEDNKNAEDEVFTDSDDSDIPDELKRDYVDELTGEIPHRRHSSAKCNSRKQIFLRTKSMPPILTNTTLNVLRLFGKYLQMMSLLLPIAFDVIVCMSQLFDYYLYTIVNFFASTNLSELSTAVYPTILRSTIKRINDNLIIQQSELIDGYIPDLHRDKVLTACLSPVVVLNDSKTMFGLPERVIAVESLIFLSEQLSFLQNYLESLMPSTKKPFLQQFYSQTVSSAVEVRKPVYLPVPWQSVKFNHVLGMMNDVQWDIVGDIMSQHSSYIDVLLKELNDFSQNLNEMARQSPIPREAYDILWSHCMRMASHMLVEGYSSAKKCSQEGRALMQLDFQQFLIKLEKITELRPIPWKEHVESYIKAFYLPETQLENWIKEHQEYSTKQLTSLIGCMSLTRRFRQKLIGLVEDSDKNNK